MTKYSNYIYDNDEGCGGGVDMNPPPPAAAAAAATLTPPRSNRRSNNTNASASSTAPVETPIASIRRSTARSMSQQQLQQQNHGGFISTPKRGDDCSSSQQLQQVVYSPLHEPKIAFDELSDSLHDYRPQLFSPKIPPSIGNANLGRLVMKSAVEEGAAVANAVAEEGKEAAVSLDENVEVKTEGTDDEKHCRNGDGYNEHVVNDDIDVSLKVQRMHVQQQQNDDGDEDDVEMMDVDEREYEEEEEQEFDEDDDATTEEEFDPYLFMHHVPPKTDYASLLQHLPKVPPKSKESPYYTLVLDLDETLVHCTVDEKLCKDPDLIFNVDFNGMSYTVYAKKRPFLVSFLQRISKAFEIVVFTASQSVYANALLDKIDPNGELIKHRIFRESCLPVHGNYLKDLTVLGPSRPLCASILVDNSPHAFAYNIDNGIPIESWFDDSNDRELLKLELFLQEHIMSRENVVDVRDVIRKEFDMKTKILEHVTFIRALAASRGRHPRNWTS